MKHSQKTSVVQISFDGIKKQIRFICYILMYLATAYFQGVHSHAMVKCIRGSCLSFVKTSLYR